MKKEKKKTKKGSKSSFWYVPFLVLLILLITFVSFLYILLSNSYKQWEVGFVESDLEFLDYQNESVDLEEKILDYNASDSEYAFIEFTKKESLFLLTQSLDESLPDWIEIQKTALDTSEGRWEFFVKSKIANSSLPWVQIVFVKEGFQSVDIHIADILVGNLSFKNFNLDIIVENANRGLERGIQLVNDGNFAGRVFVNIELTQDSLIIRSRNISF